MGSLESSATLQPPAAKPRRSNETRSAEMRAALIEAAIQSLCEVGYSKTTTQEICRRAGATSGAIQHHFGSKDELILATLECLRLEMQQRFDRLNELGGPLDARCGAMVREMWHTFYGRKRYMAVWEIAIGSRGEQRFYNRVLEQRRNTLRFIEPIWRKTLGISDNGPHEHLDAMHVVLSFLRGLVLYTEIEADEAFIEAQLAIMTSALIEILGARRNKVGRSRSKRGRK
jgi:AcrR family transcriptional regulator